MLLNLSSPTTTPEAVTLTHASARMPMSGWPWRAYAFAWHVLTPVVPVWLGGRATRGKEDPLRLKERHGVPSRPRPNGPLFWVHAASVGEANAILPLVKKLLADETEWHALITTGTRTSAQLLAKQMPPRAMHQFIPLDHPRFVNRFLNHWKPQLVLWSESELWPNLLRQTARRNIPMWLINGRMSPRSYARWLKAPKLVAELLGCFSGIFAGSARDAEHYAALARQTPVQFAGNLKYDAPELPADPLALAQLRENIGHRPVLLAASLHPGEDLQIADLHNRLKAQQWPDLLTILVPRHAARGEAIAGMMRREGLQVAQRSKHESVTSRVECYVADTMGELGLFYRLATVVIIGGSLVPHGGQNPLEPLRIGVPTVAGLYMQNFAQICDLLEQAGAFKRLLDVDALANEIALLLSNAALRAQRVNLGRSTIASQGGALERLSRQLSAQMQSINRYQPASRATDAA